MKVACILITHLPLKAEIQRCPELTQRPVLIIRTEGSRRVVADFSPGLAGIRPGMPLQKAVTFAESATLLESNDAYYQAQFDDILDALAERINETLDEQYSRSLSRYVPAGLAEKAAHGYANGVPPLGYMSDKLDNGKRERKVPDWDGIGGNPKAGGMGALLALLEAYASGSHSFYSLPDYLNAAGFRTREGKPFTKGGVEETLSNRFYEGKVV